jgi:hypothetical protein
LSLDFLLLRNNSNEIPPEVFDDLRLRPLIGKFCDEQHVDRILDVLSHPLPEAGIQSRQDVFRALEDPATFQYLSQFHKSLLNVNRIFRMYGNSANYPYNKINYLYLIDAYLAAVESAIDPAIYQGTKSHLLRDMIDHFRNVAAAQDFNRIKKRTDDLIVALRNIGKIAIRIRTIQGAAPKFSIRKDDRRAIIDDLKDASDALGFQWKEKTGQQKEATTFFVEALRSVDPLLLADLDAYDREFGGWFDTEVLHFQEQIEFYLDMDHFLKEMKALGIGQCYPRIAKSRKIHISSAKDITLLVNLKDDIIPNDIDFNETERIFLLTGANGGGKTTYLRTMGVGLVLFLNGLPIPAEDAEIYPFKAVFTHFPADESISKSRMVNERAKAESILEKADPDSVVMLNETFSSTNETSAIQESVELIVKLNERKAFTLFVTHQHGLSDYSDALDTCNVGYLEAVVLHDEENTRTFKVIRKQPDHKSYAKDILEKYGLTGEQLKQRFRDRTVPR